MRAIIFTKVRRVYGAARFVVALRGYYLCAPPPFAALHTTPLFIDMPYASAHYAMLP